MADMLASGASCYAADDQCIQTHGSIDFAEKYDVERQFRETRRDAAAPRRADQHQSDPEPFGDPCTGIAQEF
ncbi:hypothetical protein [Sphingobium sp. Z007]|uniref:hypothetical protein n=1 Tax=Sphingobium sp. Z007 TaxID=627495 RepID=UPI0020CE311D|nr:hypothetical protein [Sphingobium sp. Z007]